ncbi:MAG TPA: SAM-dependent methyltransferase [Gammaproteobacteria bacterium]|nr:SAM-dependent methyltransferase [Gammaproteobacteria bacterium]
MTYTASSPWDIPADWPAPDAIARALSTQLLERIKDEIKAADGWIDFACYMELALYAPGLGYYSAGARKFGAGGDFITAPEVSSLFSRCVARSCADVLEYLGGGDVLEVGAGSGVMAADVLLELAACGQLPDFYYILERSADLRERQQAHLARVLPQLCARVRWLDEPPTQAWRGMVLANEVLDALPVQLFGWQNDRVTEYGVGWQDPGFAWVERPAAPELGEQIFAWAKQFEWQGEYRSEYHPLSAPWLRSVTANLAAGAALFIDYGYARREYYHAERAQGTLLCHYRHRAHANPLCLPGLQDITAHVEFTGIAEAAVNMGLRVDGFTTQAHFLLDAGIESLLAAAMTGAPAGDLQLAAQAKTLLLPGEMGERFKAMLLTRGLDVRVRGFGGRDLRSRL